MEEEGGGPRLSKRFSDKGGEVDLKTKAGTAWSHNFLNQKPWHPLSYPNQRRKWIAEQTFAEKQRRAEEVSREYAQEQDFFRQAALVSKKEKEKMEMMKAVSFMYIRPPGYNAESAKAAEVAHENNKEDQGESDPSAGASTSKQLESLPPVEEKKKVRPKDVFGRHLPTGEQFEVLKNAPKMETGIQGRAKPFGIEIRNVKCVRCGNFGHQSGDRECPLKDVLMPNEESRLKRDDPLTAILAQTEAAEPLKWELKQKPGLSPPRGGFDFDDANQQIVAEDIFDEYGGFLSGEMPELLANFSSGKSKKKKSSKRKKKKHSSPSSAESSDGEENASLSEDDRKKSSKKRKLKRRLSPSTSEASDDERSGMYSEREKERRSKKLYRKKSGKHYSDPSTSEASDEEKRWMYSEREKEKRSKKLHKKRSGKHYSDPSTSEASDEEKSRMYSEREKENTLKKLRKKKTGKHYSDLSTSKASDEEKGRMYSEREKEKRLKKLHKKKTGKHYSDLSTSEDDHDRHRKERSKCSDHLGSNRRHKSRHRHNQSSDDDLDRYEKRSRRNQIEAESSDKRSRRGQIEAESSDHSDFSRHRRHHHRHRAPRSSSPAHSDARGRYRHHHCR